MAMFISCVLQVGTNVSAGLSFGIESSATHQALTAQITEAQFPLSVLQSSVGNVHIAGLSDFTNKLVRGRN